MRVLVTGAAGFIGSRLLPALQGEGIEVWGSSFDLLDYDAVQRELVSSPWDMLIHLAGVSHVPTAESNPKVAYEVNVTGTALLLEALRAHSPETHFVFASTAQVYAAPEGGERQEGVIFDEARRVCPQNVYARTKRAAEVWIEDLSRTVGVSATVLRLFNHTHKSQSPDFFLPYLYAQLLTAKAERLKEIPIGNLDLYRDMGSVDDLVEALVRLVVLQKTRKAREVPSFEVFNICSGTAKSLRRLAEQLALQMGVSVSFRVDPSRVRPGEPRSICGSSELFQEKTGWRPRIQSEEDLIRAFLAD